MADDQADLVRPADLVPVLAALAQRAGGDVEIGAEEVESYRTRHVVHLLAGEEPGSVRVAVHYVGRGTSGPATTVR